MANHASHAALPFPIKGARFTVAVPYLDADGDPTDPTTPDTEVSKDGAAFADCAEEVSTIAGANGAGYITLSGAETDCSLLALAAKAASGPKATLLALYPRLLADVESGTAQAGAAGSITLAAGAAAFDLAGCFVKTTGGTGGGGTGGANNQARRIVAYNTSTKVATVEPNWETNPDATTTYEILLPEGMTLGALKGTVGPSGITAASFAANALTEDAIALSGRAAIGVAAVDEYLLGETGLTQGAIPADSAAALTGQQLLETTLWGTRKVKHALRAAAAFIIGKRSGAGTATETLRDPDDTKNAAVYTLDEHGNRPTIVTDLD